MTATSEGRAHRRGLPSKTWLRGRLLWRDKLDQADDALRRKFVTALDMAVFIYPDGCQPRWPVRTDWNAAMAGWTPAMAAADFTFA